MPTSDLTGERAWPTQPISLEAGAVRAAGDEGADSATLTPSAHAALTRLRTLRNGGLFTPPSRQGTIVLPGFDGGGEWGGAAVDRELA